MAVDYVAQKRPFLLIGRFHSKWSSTEIVNENEWNSSLSPENPSAICMETPLRGGSIPQPLQSMDPKWVSASSSASFSLITSTENRIYRTKDSASCQQLFIKFAEQIWHIFTQPPRTRTQTDRKKKFAAWLSFEMCKPTASVIEWHMFTRQHLQPQCTRVSKYVKSIVVCTL